MGKVWFGYFENYLRWELVRINKKIKFINDFNFYVS